MRSGEGRGQVHDGCLNVETIPRTMKILICKRTLAGNFI